MTDIKDLNMKDLNNFLTAARDKFLGSMNLAPRRPGIFVALQGIGMFTAGAVVGGAFGLLFAPTSGAELRKSLVGFFSKASKKVVDTVEHQVQNMEAEGGASKPGSRASHQA